MEQWGKLCCLLLVLLVSDPADVHGQYVPGRWSSQWNPWPVVGSAHGSSRQLSQQQRISVRCQEQEMVVTVQRDLFGTGKLVKASDMTLGPLLCPHSSQSTDAVLTFQVGLHECGNRLQIESPISEDNVHCFLLGMLLFNICAAAITQSTEGEWKTLIWLPKYFKYWLTAKGPPDYNCMTADWLIYSTNLTYSPTPYRNSPITRTNPALVPIQCYYPKYHNVSSKAIKPTWVPFSSTLSVEERLSFSLHLMTDDWSSQRTSTVFQLGDVFLIEASIDTGNHVPMTIFVDRCVATLSPDVNSNPRYEIIALNGCLVDGKQEDSSSAFRSPRPQPDKLQFMIDAFRFSGTDSSMIYITCNLRAAAATQQPGATNKACSFNQASNTWSTVEGPSNICSCCDTGVCEVPTQSRRLYPHQSSRRTGKRGALSRQNSEKQISATIGPLLVIGPETNKTLASHQEPK